MRKCLFLMGALAFLLDAQAAQSGHFTEAAFDDIRIEIDDLKYALKSTQVELNLLDERLKKQDNSLLATRSSSKEMGGLTAQVTVLEKKVSQIEKLLDKAVNDLRTISTSANQALSKIQTLEQDFTSQEKRLDEVAKLKGTLTSISKAMQQKPSVDLPSASRSYSVKAGDSLERIARINHTSADVIRKLNHLASDKIHPGQELRLPDDAP